MFTFFTGLAKADDPSGTNTISRAGDSGNFAIQVNDESELIELLDITRKIVSNSKLYAFLNEVFKEHLVVSEELQIRYNWPSRVKGLSEPQILFLLKNLPHLSLTNLLEKYLSKIPEFSQTDPSRKVFVDSLKKEFEIILKNGDVIAKLQGLNDPAKTLNIGYASGIPVVTDADIHFNTPYDKDPNKPTDNGDVPAEDLKEKMIELFRSAKRTFSSNIFENNLTEIVDEIEAALKRGVNGRLGIDKNTTQLAPENIAAVKRLEELQKKYPDQFKLVLVDPTGLNHQKIIVVDAGTKDARMIYSSGNMTQSCIGKEGDAVKLPPELRPVKSKPNANHVVYWSGALPSLIIEHELNKTLDQKLRGQKEYPVSGSYSFDGEHFPGYEKKSVFNIAFSPNGGLGHVNSSITVPIILRSQGTIYFWQFVASDKSMYDGVIQVAAQAPDKFNLKGAFDPPFGMQAWSIPLALAGLKRDPVTKRYSVDKESSLRRILRSSGFNKLKKQIKLNTRIYGEFHYKIETPNGTENVRITRKMHNKIMIFPLIHTAVVGTSFNPSASAEGNQEQYMWIENHPIVKKAEAAFLFDHRNSNTTVTEQARRRNEFIKEPDLILPKSKPNLEIERTKLRMSVNPLDEDPGIEIRSGDLESDQVSRDRHRMQRNQCSDFY